MNPWLIFASITIALVIGGPTACIIHSNQMVTNMVKAGATPTEARCALKSDINVGEQSVTCLTAALLRSIEGKFK